MTGEEGGVPRRKGKVRWGPKHRLRSTGSGGGGQGHVVQSLQGQDRDLGGVPSGRESPWRVSDRELYVSVLCDETTLEVNTCDASAPRPAHTVST